MLRLVLWYTDDGGEYVSIITQEDYYKEVGQTDVVGDVDLSDLDYDFGLWPTDRPLAVDF